MSVPVTLFKTTLIPEEYPISIERERNKDIITVKYIAKDSSDEDEDPLFYFDLTITNDYRITMSIIFHNDEAKDKFINEYGFNGRYNYLVYLKYRNIEFEDIFDVNTTEAISNAELCSGYLLYHNTFFRKNKAENLFETLRYDFNNRELIRNLEFAIGKLK